MAFFWSFVRRGCSRWSRRFQKAFRLPLHVDRDHSRWSIAMTSSIGISRAVCFSISAGSCRSQRLSNPVGKNRQRSAHCFAPHCRQRRRIARSTPAFSHGFCRRRVPPPLPLRFVRSPVLRIGDQTIAMFRCQPDRFRPIARNQKAESVAPAGIQFRLHGVVFCVVHDVLAAPQCTDDTNRVGKSVPAFLPVRPFTGRGRVRSTPHPIGRQEMCARSELAHDANAPATIAGS